MPAGNQWGPRDLFASTVAPGWTYPARYIRADVWTAPQAIGATTVISRRGYLFDGHADSQGHRRPAALAAATTGDDRTCTVLERGTEIEDGEVQLAPEFVTETGKPGPDAFRSVFLWGRVQGGILQSPGDEEYHRLPDGYFFAQVGSAGNQTELVVGRAQAGVATILDSVELRTFEPLRPGVDVHSVRTMRMTVIGSTITCYRQVRSGAIDVTNPSSGSLQEVQVLQVTDGAITGDGRWGFGGQVFKNTLDGWRGGVRFQRFEIRNALGTTIFRDRFRRWRRDSAVERTDEVGATGRSLMSAWTGDGASRHATRPHWGHLLLNGPALDLGRDIDAALGTAGQNYGWYISQDPAKSDQQHHSLRVSYVGDVTVDREAGIMLRGTWAPDTSGVPDFRSEAAPGDPNELDTYKQGYLLVLEYLWNGGAPTWSLVFYHYDGSQNVAYVPPALASVDLGALGLTFGTNIDLALEVRNFDTDEQGNGGNVALRATVDGAIVTPVADSGIQGLAVLDDWLFDQRSAATRQGRGRGWFYQPSAHGSVTMNAERWTSEPLSDPPIDDADDQASVAVDAEDAGKVGTLVTPVGWPIRRKPGYFFRDAVGGHGHLHRSPRFDRGRQAWSVSMRGADRVERAALVAFWEEHFAGRIPFDWQREDTGEIIPVLFRGPVLGHSQRTASGYGVEDYRFELIEVFPASVFNAGV